MAILVQCSACGAKYNVADAMAGKKVRCKKCGSVFPVTAPGGAEALPDEPDLSSVPDDQDPDDAPAAPSRQPAATAPRRPKVLPPVSQMPGQRDDGDDDEEFDEDEADEAAKAPTYAPNPLFSFPGAHFLDIALPIVIALSAIGWMLVATLNADSFGRSWLPHLRWCIYLAAYSILVFPVTLWGIHRVGAKLRFGNPGGHVWKVYCVFTLPCMLGAILSLKDGSAATVIAGIAVGLMAALLAFWFQYRLRPWQTTLGVGLVAAYFTGGMVMAALLGFAINLTVFSSMEKSKTAYTFGTSPIAPVYPWNATPPPPEPKHHPLAIAAPASETPTTEPSTTQPGVPETTPPTTPPTTAPVAVVPAVDPTTPDKKMTIEVTPKLDPPSTAPATQPAPVSPATAPAVALSPFVESVTPETSVGEFDDIVYSPLAGEPAALIVRSRGATADNLELWSTQPFEKKSAITLRHPMNDQTVYWLSPKANTFARLTDFPHKAIEIFSTTEEKVLRAIDLDAAKLGTPELIGFAAGNQIGVLWESNSLFGIEMLDTTTGQRTRLIPLPKFERARGNISISPDGKFLAVAVKALLPARSDATPKPDADGTPPPAPEPRPMIQLSDISAGRVPPRLLQIKDLGPDKPSLFSALTFSPDSQKLSLLFEENGNSLIVTWKPPETKQVSQEVVYASRPAGTGADYHGNALDNLPAPSTWLLYGNTIIQAGRAIGDLGMPNVKGHQFLSRDTLALTLAAEGGKLKLVTLKLHPDKFPPTAKEPKPPSPKP